MKNDRLENLSKNGYEVPIEVVEYLDTYIFNRKKEVDELKQLIPQGMSKKVFQIAHKIKGNGSSFGFSSLTYLATGLEVATQADDLVKAKQIIDELDFEIQKISKILGHVPV